MRSDGTAERTSANDQPQTAQVPHEQNNSVDPFAHYLDRINTTPEKRARALNETYDDKSRFSTA